MQASENLDFFLRRVAQGRDQARYVIALDPRLGEKETQLLPDLPPTANYYRPTSICFELGVVGEVIFDSGLVSHSRFKCAASLPLARGGLHAAELFHDTSKCVQRPQLQVLCVDRQLSTRTVRAVVCERPLAHAGHSTAVGHAQAVWGHNLLQRAEDRGRRWLAADAPRAGKLDSLPCLHILAGQKAAAGLL